MNIYLYKYNIIYINIWAWIIIGAFTTKMFRSKIILAFDDKIIVVMFLKIYICFTFLKYIIYIYTQSS